MCTACRAREGEALKTRRARYLGALTALDLDGELTPHERSVLAETPPPSVGIEWHRSLAHGAVVFLVKQALVKGELSVEDEARIGALGRLIRADVDVAIERERGLAAAVTIGRANAGRLPVVEAPAVPLREHEVSHLEVRADLVRLEASTEAGEAEPGVWIPKGRAVPAESGPRPAAMDADGRPLDHGIVAVTSDRVAFLGQRLQVDFPYGSFAGTMLYADGVELRLAGRRRRYGLKLAEPGIIATMVRAACLHAPPAPRPKAPAGGRRTRRKPRGSP